MNGLVNSNVEVIDAMDEGGTGKYIKVKLTKTGSINGKTTSHCNTSEFEAIFAYIRANITNMANGILNGNCKAQSIMKGTYTCEYCPYSSVCLSKTSKFDVDEEDEEEDKEPKNSSKDKKKESSVERVLGKIKEYLEGDENNANMDESTTECD